MPGIAVLSPTSPTNFTPKLTEMQNGASYHRDIIADIKAGAREKAQGVRGASPTQLLSSARSQMRHAATKELEGDLENALSAYTKAAFLIQFIFDSPELKVDGHSAKKGQILRDLLDFQQNDGRDIVAKTHAVEARLSELEKATSQPSNGEKNSDSVVVKTSGGTIADRMQSLKNAGMTVATTKRISREIPTSPALPMSPPMSPIAARPPSLLSLQMHSPPTAPPSSFSRSLDSPTVSAPSPHVLVPTSSLGPPSPSSSTSSSPQMTSPNLQEFASTFPSIDELEEMEGMKIPHFTGNSAARSSGRKLSISHANGVSHPRPFPILPMDINPRPSSTPIPPTIDTFQSRPSSPMRIPISPTVPRKPSYLSMNTPLSSSHSSNLSTSVPRSPVITATPSVEKAELPFKTLFPKTLHEWRDKPNFKILLLDVRTREEFEREHIRAPAVVCIEPSILQRDNVTGSTIENALNISPRDEFVLFSNRDKFDMVAIYDDASESMGEPSPVSSLFKAIYELAFQKFLKNMPMLLIGGFQAWKRQYGEEEIMSGSSVYGARPIHSAVNGISPSLVNGTGIPGTPTEPKSLGLGHMRAPAEFSTTSSIITPVPSAPPVDLGAIPLGRARSGTESVVDANVHRQWFPSGVRPPAESLPGSPKPGMDSVGSLPSVDKRLTRRPAMSRSGSNSVSYPATFTPVIDENMPMQHISPSLSSGNPSIPIQYPPIVRHVSPQVTGSSFSPSSTGVNGLSLPPQASINPSPLSRRRSDYVDQSQEALNGLVNRTPIDYPELSSQHVLRPPPIAASSTLDNRPRISNYFVQAQTGPRPPTIQSDYPVTYWSDTQIGTSGLKNLGNTCYMNSTIQCLSATVPFSRFFTDGRWKNAVNMMNPMGTKGVLAAAFANILRDMWQGQGVTLSPVTFRRSICGHAPQFSGSEQHDSQEFLSFLLDGLHEDLNRILQKRNIESTPEREAELEKLPPQIASEQEWQIYRMRDDSLIVDFFQGQYRNRMQCLTCNETSTTYNTFMYLTLPIPTGRASKVTLQQCIDAFVKEEVMEKSDAWNCPHCKALRKATKRLSLSRLPPVLLIHLKRFSAKGPFTDKIETFVEFPLKGLDLTNYMPPPLPPGAIGVPPLSTDDPRCQLPPYRYDLYGVTNHFGTLSTGHYTAFIASRGRWLYCDDSRVTPTDAKEVVGKPAYILFYKRTKA